jgi:hypothetical protein
MSFSSPPDLSIAADPDPFNASYTQREAKNKTHTDPI